MKYEVSKVLDINSCHEHDMLAILWDSGEFHEPLVVFGLTSPFHVASWFLFILLWIGLLLFLELLKVESIASLN